MYTLSCTVYVHTYVGANRYYFVPLHTYTFLALPLQASSSILSQPEKPVFRPHLEHKHTEPRPFPFEQRYQGKARRQDLVQKELEKQHQELEQVGQGYRHRLAFSPNPIPTSTCWGRYIV